MILGKSTTDPPILLWRGILHYFCLLVIESLIPKRFELAWVTLQGAPNLNIDQGNFHQLNLDDDHNLCLYIPTDWKIKCETADAE